MDGGGFVHRPDSDDRLSHPGSAGRYRRPAAPPVLVNVCRSRRAPCHTGQRRRRRSGPARSRRSSHAKGLVLPTAIPQKAVIIQDADFIPATGDGWECREDLKVRLETGNAVIDGLVSAMPPVAPSPPPPRREKAAPTAPPTRITAGRQSCSKASSFPDRGPSTRCWQSGAHRRDRAAGSGHLARWHDP